LGIEIIEDQDKIIAEMDSDGNGAIDFAELAKA
jgi:Ca2+-binding EF-hand superfamily protein